MRINKLVYDSTSETCLVTRGIISWTGVTISITALIGSFVAIGATSRLVRNFLDIFENLDRSLADSTKGDREECSDTNPERQEKGRKR